MRRKERLAYKFPIHRHITEHHTQIHTPAHIWFFKVFNAIVRFAITPQLYFRVYNSTTSLRLVLILQIIKGWLIISFCHTEVSQQKERKYKDGSLIL